VLIKLLAEERCFQCSGFSMLTGVLIRDAGIRGMTLNLGAVILVECRRPEWRGAGYVFVGLFCKGANGF
jgi:hypothetical protein